MEEIKIQWHPGFVAAMDLEFGENRKQKTEKTSSMRKNII